MPSKKSIPAKAETPDLVCVTATIPPHVANVLMRELDADTTQEAVDKVLAMLTDEPLKKRKGKL